MYEVEEIQKFAIAVTSYIRIRWILIISLAV